MNKGVYKKLRQFAKDLPELYEHVRIVKKVLGSEIIAKNSKSPDANGNAINPSRIYNCTMYERRRINIDTLKKVYNMDGIKGVEKLVSQLQAQKTNE